MNLMVNGNAEPYKIDSDEYLTTINHCVFFKVSASSSSFQALVFDCIGVILKDLELLAQDIVAAK